MDFEQLFTFGEMGKFINTVVEVAQGSILKVEFDRSKKVFVLDRVEPSIFKKPVNYGFIPGTTDEDNDALDTLIIAEEPMPMGLVVKARVVAVLNFVDGGENDHKIVCVPEDDRNSSAHIMDLSSLTEQWKKQVEHHFNHYKDLKKPDSVNVVGWGDSKAAWEVISECINRYKK